MRNACIVVKNGMTLDGAGEIALLDGFSLCGYALDEVRLLPPTGRETLLSALREGKEKYNILLLLAEKAALSAVKDLLLAEFAQSSLGGLYEAENCTLLLLTIEDYEEGQTLFKTLLVPHVERKFGVRLERVTLRSVGASEERLQSLLAQAKRSAQGMQIQRIRRFDEDIISIFYDSTASKMTVDGVIRLFADGLEDSVYAVGDTSLEEQLVTLLKVRGKRLSVAESFTGGGIARRITSVSGASEVYFEGLNTYDEDAKRKRLGVAEYTLRTAGAVSDETAYQMALGLLSSGDCDFAIATTGLAGPKSDKSMLPVGLSYIAVGTKEKIFVYRYKFEGTRREITEKAIQYALFLAYKKLKDL